MQKGDKKSTKKVAKTNKIARKKEKMRQTQGSQENIVTKNRTKKQ